MRTNILLLALVLCSSVFGGDRRESFIDELSVRELFVLDENGKSVITLSGGASAFVKLAVPGGTAILDVADA